MSIINVFDSEKDLFNLYPKNKYFKIQIIFQDYWNLFLDWADKHNLKIRSVVKRDVERMMICKTPHLGYSIYTCPHCNNILKLVNPDSVILVGLNMLSKEALILNLNF